MDVDFVNGLIGVVLALERSQSEGPAQMRRIEAQCRSVLASRPTCARLDDKYIKVAGSDTTSGQGPVWAAEGSHAYENLKRTGRYMHGMIHGGQTICRCLFEVQYENRA